MDNQQFPQPPQPNDSDDNAQPQPQEYYTPPKQQQEQAHEQPQGTDHAPAPPPAGTPPDQNPPYDAVNLQDATPPEHPPPQDSGVNEPSASQQTPSPPPENQQTNSGTQPSQTSQHGQMFAPPENQYVQLQSSQPPVQADHPQQQPEQPPSPEEVPPTPAPNTAQSDPTPQQHNQPPEQTAADTLSPQPEEPATGQEQPSDYTAAQPQPQPQQPQAQQQPYTDPPPQTSWQNQDEADTAPPLDTYPAQTAQQPAGPTPAHTQTTGSQSPAGFEPESDPVAQAATGQDQEPPAPPSQPPQPPPGEEQPLTDNAQPTGGQSPQQPDETSDTMQSGPQRPLNQSSPSHNYIQPLQDTPASSGIPAQPNADEQQTPESNTLQPETHVQEIAPGATAGTENYSQLRPSFSPDNPPQFQYGQGTAASQFDASGQSGTENNSNGATASTASPIAEQTAAQDNATFQLPPTQQLQTTPEQQSDTGQPTAEPSSSEATAASESGQKGLFGSTFTGIVSRFKKINFKSALSAAIIGIVIFGIFNAQVILGQVQYLTTPSGGIQEPSVAINAESPAGDKPQILIPQIDVNVPVVYDEPSFKEKKVQQALERGVVHYGTTALPGENGNTVIVGHSSNNWWDSGKYKFAFILLDKLTESDKIVLHYQGTRYVYEVENKEVVEPTNTSVLDQTDKPRLTLITCTPPGTSWKRLVVQARQVTPDPSRNTEPERTLPQGADMLPSDSSRSFFEFMGDLF